MGWTFSAACWYAAWEMVSDGTKYGISPGFVNDGFERPAESWGGHMVAVELEKDE